MMNDKDFIVICAIISIMFVYLLDNAFIISNEPARHIAEFTVNNTTILKAFDCEPDHYSNHNTLICTDGEEIKP